MVVVFGPETGQDFESDGRDKEDMDENNSSASRVEKSTFQM